MSSGKNTLTFKTPFAQPHGENHREGAKEKNEGKRNDEPYELQTGEAPAVEAGH